MKTTYSIFYCLFLIIQIILLININAIQIVSFDFDFEAIAIDRNENEFARILSSTKFQSEPAISLDQFVQKALQWEKNSDQENICLYFLGHFVRKLFIWKTQGITFKQVLENINTAIQFKKNHPLYLQQVFHALLEKFTNQNTLILAQQASKIKVDSHGIPRKVDWSKFLNMEALKTMLIQKNFFIVQNADAQFEENELLTNENYDTIINKNYTFFSLPFFKDWFHEYKQLIDQEKKLDEYKKSIKKKKKQFYFTIGTTAIVIIILSVFILHKYRNKHIRSK